MLMHTRRPHTGYFTVGAISVAERLGEEHKVDITGAKSAETFAFIIKRLRCKVSIYVYAYTYTKFDKLIYYMKKPGIPGFLRIMAIYYGQLSSLKCERSAPHNGHV